MLKRVVHLSVASLLCLPLVGCSGGDDEQMTFGGSFSTAGTTFPTSAGTATDPTTSEESTTEDSAGDGDGDGTTTTATVTDTDPTTDNTDTDQTTDPSTTDDTSCPPGEFGCPCDNGGCVVGLECIAGECGFPQGDGDGDPTTGDPTTGGGNDPWDPNNCGAPSMLVSITDIEGSLCSAPCASDIDCPAGPGGTNPACALVLEGAMDPNQCALLCDPLSDTCSPGATCKDVPGQPGLGICTYP